MAQISDEPGSNIPNPRRHNASDESGGKSRSHHRRTPILSAFRALMPFQHKAPIWLSLMLRHCEASAKRRENSRNPAEV